MADIRQRIGLDYLGQRGTQKKGREEAAAPSPPPFLSDALLSYGRPLLEAVRRAAPGTAHLHDVIDELKIPIDIALRLVDYLQEQHHLLVVRRDLRGNHELQLTDEGLKLLR